MKYAALKFTSTNIGDEIQSIAAQRFLPGVDYYIFRERMNKFFCDEKVKLIMNSWYMWRPKNFPPNDCVDPLLISMFFNPDCRKEILTPKGIAFLKEHGPVGCRDLSTQRWLEDNGIPAYYSSCLTLTLVPNKTLKARYPEKYILCVDCPKEVEEYAEKNSEYPVYSFKKLLSPYIESLDRMELAKVVLFMYHNAHCVITTNLHTAAPCLAFGTSVCLLKKKTEASHGVGRFEGMETFFNWQTTEEFLNGGYDLNSPIPNPKEFEKYRDALIGKCTEFTGFDSRKPTLDDDFEPLHKVISMLALNHNNVRRTLYWASTRDLLKMLFLKVFKKVDMYDIDDNDYLKIRKDGKK